MEQVHVARLKKHRNILYGIVVILLIIQILSFTFITLRLTNVQASQDKISKEILQSLDETRQDSQYKFNAIASELSAQKSSFNQQIQFLKTSQSDFSGVIDEVIKGMATIATDKSSGSGFIVDSSGYVVTNQHVIDNNLFVKVITYDGKTYNAIVVGQDDFNDVALLKIGGNVFPRVEFANSNDIQIGEKVIAIGNPLGLSFTVTEGIVSALHRKGPNGQTNYIQTDVTLNPGNSGGPLINKDGKIIGMNNFKLGQSEGLGFALESNVVKSVEESLRSGIKNEA
jgi:S1-C subfamily serine protease